MTSSLNYKEAGYRKLSLLASNTKGDSVMVIYYVYMRGYGGYGYTTDLIPNYEFLYMTMTYSQNVYIVR